MEKQTSEGCAEAGKAALLQQMKRKLRAPEWVWGMLALAGVAVFFAATVPIIFPAPPPLDKYEAAKRQTVFVGTADGSGSGFVIERRNTEGKKRFFVFTAAHVTAGQSEFKIDLFIRSESRKVGKTEFNAVLIASNSALDLSLLWLDCPDGFVQGAQLADDIRIGDPVFHIGNYLGESFDNSLAVGVIAQTGVRPDPVRFDGWPWITADQANFLVMPGSSGGPVFNQEGKVIGMVVGVIAPGASFYVPFRTIAKWVPSWVFGTGCPSDVELLQLADDNYAAPKPVADSASPEH